MAEKTDYSLILVIDDEESIRDGCRQVLEKSNYSVITSANGDEGLQLAREISPAIAFIDLKMPGLSGMEVVDILSKDIPDTVLIVITGYASIVSAVEAMKKGVYDYLPKPFTPDQLRAIAQRGIDHRNLKLETQILRKEKKEMENNFITFVSHEMRSPLVTIRQYMESLKVVAGDNLGGDAVDIIKRCSKRIRNLEELVEHWLDLRRIDEGTLVRKKKPMNLSGTIMKCIDEMEPLCTRRDLTLEVNVPADLPTMVGDKESLSRVFINIIGNATKYTPKGGTLSIRAEYDDHYIVITIADTGIGIPSDKFLLIFEPFYRIKGKGDQYRGSGLGLSFCKKIMKAHDGRIEVASEEGKGTTFSLTFSRQTHPVTKRGKEESSAREKGRTDS